MAPRKNKASSVKNTSVKKTSIKHSSVKHPSVKNRSLLRRLFIFILMLGLVGTVTLAGYSVFLDAQIRTLFDGSKWSMPAKVYAKPLTLTLGQEITEQQLLSNLLGTGYQEIRTVGVIGQERGTFKRQGDRWIVQRRSFNYLSEQYPAIEVDIQLRRGEITQLLLNNQLAPDVVLEPQYMGGIVPQHSEDRDLIRLEDVPPQLVAALILTEDRGFFDHWGISPRGIARAMVQNAKAGRMVQGGSTLTQQLVKNFFLNSNRSLSRKLNEAIMSVLLEIHYDKEEILETYINEVYFGQSGKRAIHGFELAARFFFGRPLSELGLSEYATLVGMVKGPSLYNPRRNPDRSADRRNVVLEIMAQQGAITQTEKAEAQNKPLRVATAQHSRQRAFPAFIDLVKRQLNEDYSPEDLQTAGLNIYTTFDPWFQQSLEKSALAHMERLVAKQTDLEEQLQVAAILTDVKTGAVRAMLGGRDTRLFGYNRALDMRRSIGSLAKPAVYLAALSSGSYHWGSRIDDSPVAVQGPEDVWRPQNYDKQSHGIVPLRDALALSYNQATARLGMKVGLEKVVKEFERLGIEDDIPPYPSLLLGASELSPYSMSQMYQTIASHGYYAPLHAIEAVTTQLGEVLTAYPQEPEQRYDEQLIRWFEYGLREVVLKGTAKRLGRRYGDGLAGKTGTSDQQRDAWYTGYDRQLVGVVWVGRDDNLPMPFTGSSAALPIWHETFETIGIQEIKDDPRIKLALVDNDGRLVGEGCSGDLYPFPPAWLQNSPPPCRIEAPTPIEDEKSWWQKILRRK